MVAAGEPSAAGGYRGAAAKPQPPATAAVLSQPIMPRRTLAIPVACLFHHVRQQSQEPCPLDGARQFALLVGRDRGYAARHDLAAFGNEALQQPHVLVVDLRGIRAGERARFAPTKERPAGGTATAAGRRSG